jgi:hypothetical protein
MKEKQLTIQIRRSIPDIFDFLLDPHNTPRWIDSIKKEETNEWPVKVGTIYRNQGEDQVWNHYTLTKLDPEKMFEMVKSDENYHVRYTFKKLTDNSTELNYLEWVETGELAEPLGQEALEKLKLALEK